MAVPFVDESWAESKSGKGMYSHTDYVQLSSLSRGTQVKCHSIGTYWTSA